MTEIILLTAILVGDQSVFPYAAGHFSDRDSLFSCVSIIAGGSDSFVAWVTVSQARLGLPRDSHLLVVVADEGAERHEEDEATGDGSDALNGAADVGNAVAHANLSGGDCLCVGHNCIVHAPSDKISTLGPKLMTIFRLVISV